MKRNTTKTLLAFTLLTAFFVFGSKAYTQNQINVSILESTWVVPDTILPIDATVITSSAEATSAILSELEKAFPDSASIAGFLERKEKVVVDLDTLELNLKDQNIEEMGSRLIQNYKSKLLLLQSAFEGLKDELDESNRNLQEQWNKMDYISKVWQQTLNDENTETLSGSLQDRSVQVMAEVTDKKEMTVGIADKLLNMRDQLLTANQSLEKLLLQITNAEDAFQHNYLNKTHSALWETDSVSPTASSPAKVFRSIFKAYSDGMPGFYAVYRTRIFFHLAIFIFLLTVSFIIRRNLNKRKIETTNERILTFLKIFNRPIAVSLTLAIFIGFLIYPNAPMVIRDINALAIIIPLVLVSLQVLPKRLHVFLFVISGLFLFEELVETVKYETSPLPRFLILIVMLLTGAYVLWLIINRNLKHKNAAKRKIKLVDVALLLALIILSAALIANIFGYVAFGFWLFRSLIISVMAALLLSVSVTIVDGFFTLIIMGNSSQMYGMVKEYGDMLVNKIIKVVKLFALIYWVAIVLKRFLIYEPVMDWLTYIMETKLVIGKEMTISLEGVLIFFLIIFLTIWFARFVKVLLEKELFPRVKLSRGVPGMINMIIRIAIITTGFILAIGVLGIDMTKLTILVGALGVGIGFGLQDLINNLISGFILIFERPIQVGDTVQFGEKEGKVEEIGIRSSIIKTYDGSEVIVPNGKLISNELINLTLSDPILRIEIDIGTVYGSDPQEVIDILVMQAKLHPEITKNPETFAIFFGYGDFALKFRLYTYTLEVNSRLRIRSELNLAIFQALKEAGIEIPYPIQDLNVNILDKKETEK